jgi:Fe-S cluster assembly protein SufD
MNYDFMNKLKNGFAVINKFAEDNEKLFFSEQRQSAFTLFTEQGLPSKNNEEWRFADLRFLNNSDFEPVYGESDTPLPTDVINRFLFDEANTNVLVFINGIFSDKHSVIKKYDKNVYLGSLRNAAHDDDKFAGMINIDFSDSEESFINLNTAFSQDGAFIYIPENVELAASVHILHIIDARNKNPFINIKNVIISDRNSRVKIIETTNVIGESTAFVNSVTAITTGCHSAMNYYKFQNEDGDLYNLNYTNVVQMDSSAFESNAVTLQSKFVRNNLKIVHRGEHCDTSLNGFYFLESNDFVDNHTMVDHYLPGNTSNQLYKGIIGGHATAVFDGKVLVRQDAQKTVSYQSNKNVLISDDATVHTKPQLEIYADDVQCSHGATSGSIEEEPLFYLQSRGIGRDKAFSLLLNAFAADVIDKIRLPELRETIKRQIADRLGIRDTDISGLLD